MNYHLAQINIAKFILPAKHPQNDDFNNAIDRVNKVGEQMDGFIWRFIESYDENVGQQVFGDPKIVVNMSVWRDLEALTQFVYRTPDHLDIMKRRKQWFEKIETPMVLWWVKQGEIPTIQDGKKRLEYLALNGPSQEGFLFSKPFAAPDGSAVTPTKDKCA